MYFHVVKKQVWRSALYTLFFFLLILHFLAVAAFDPSVCDLETVRDVSNSWCIHLTAIDGSDSGEEGLNLEHVVPLPRHGVGWYEVLK